jgi:hypothetical protein
MSQLRCAGGAADVDSATHLSQKATNRPHLSGLSRRTFRNSSGPFISFPFRFALTSDVAPTSPNWSITSDASCFARSRELLQSILPAGRGCARRMTSAISSSRRMASDRSGLSSWLCAHASSFSTSSSVNRISRARSRRVGGCRPGEFRGIALDLRILGTTTKVMELELQAAASPREDPNIEPKSAPQRGYEN